MSMCCRHTSGPSGIGASSGMFNSGMTLDGSYVLLLDPGLSDANRAAEEVKDRGDMENRVR